MADQVWKVALNSQLTSWFIIKRGSIGKPRFILRVCIVIFIIIQCLMFILGYFIGPIAQRLLLVVFSIGGVAIMSKFLRKLSKFEDNIAIQSELTWQLKTGILGIILMFLTAISNIIFRTNEERIAFSLAYSIIPCIILLCLLLISTVWVLYQLIQNTRENRKLIGSKKHKKNKYKRKKNTKSDSKKQQSSHSSKSPEIMFLTRFHSNREKMNHDTINNNKNNKTSGSNENNNNTPRIGPTSNDLDDIGMEVTDFGRENIKRIASASDTGGVNTPEESFSHTESASTSKEVTMQRFLATERGFKIFVRLLVKEYALEVGFDFALFVFCVSFVFCF